MIDCCLQKEACHSSRNPRNFLTTMDCRFVLHVAQKVVKHWQLFVLEGGSHAEPWVQKPKLGCFTKLSGSCCKCGDYRMSEPSASFCLSCVCSTAVWYPSPRTPSASVLLVTSVALPHGTQRLCFPCPSWFGFIPAHVVGRPLPSVPINHPTADPLAPCRGHNVTFGTHNCLRPVVDETPGVAFLSAGRMPMHEHHLRSKVGVGSRGRFLLLSLCAEVGVRGWIGRSMVVARGRRLRFALLLSALGHLVFLVHSGR